MSAHVKCKAKSDGAGAELGRDSQVR